MRKIDPGRLNGLNKLVEQSLRVWAQDSQLGLVLTVCPLPLSNTYFILSACCSLREQFFFLFILLLCVSPYYFGLLAISFLIYNHMVLIAQEAKKD
jgi:hypothetical protein